jgi:hypothetical protein
LDQTGPQNQGAVDGRLQGKACPSQQEDAPVEGLIFRRVCCLSNRHVAQPSSNRDALTQLSGCLKQARISSVSRLSVNGLYRDLDIAVASLQQFTCRLS